MEQQQGVLDQGRGAPPLSIKERSARVQGYGFQASGLEQIIGKGHRVMGVDKVKRQTKVLKVGRRPNSGGMASEAEVTAARLRANLYESTFAADRHRSKSQPLSNEEVAVFRAARYSPRTLKTRKSHLKKISRLLRRERARCRLPPESDFDIGEQYTPENIETISAAMAAEGIGTARNYLSSWKSAAPLSHASDAATSRATMAAASSLKKFGKGPTQSDDLPLGALHNVDDFYRQAPLNPGGAIFPYLTVMVCCLWMWRSIASRSLEINDVSNTEDSSCVITGARKNSQHGRRRIRRTTIRCLCAVTSLCPSCFLEHLVTCRHASARGTALMSTTAGLPVKAGPLSVTYGKIATELGLSKTNHITPHSARITGCRHWSRMGASENTIMTMGDWRSAEVLRHYLGTSVAAQNLLREVQAAAATEAAPTRLTRKRARQVGPRGVQGRDNALPGGNRPRVASKAFDMNDIEMAMRRAITTARGHTIATDVPPDMLEQNLAVASLRPPHRWHHLCAPGGDAPWRTRCGSTYEPATMSLRRWSEKETFSKYSAQPTCLQCLKFTGSSASHIVPDNSGK